MTRGRYLPLTSSELGRRCYPIRPEVFREVALVPVADVERHDLDAASILG
jgi:hypothetical protein